MTERFTTSSTNPNDAISKYLGEPELRNLVEFGRRLSEPESAPLTPGSMLGRYVVEEQIGGGGFGLVYLANDPTLNRVVVIKVQKSPLRGTGLDEARTVALLSHPNVVTVHDVVEMPDNSWAMVMPQLEGTSIGYTEDISQTINYLVQAAGALAHIHASGYVHQDLKPANILLDRSGNVIVCDFGLAANEQLNGYCEAGSPPYMSPEQIIYGVSDRRSDVWSFGIVMYELLSGKRPFTGRNRRELFHCICSTKPLDLITANPKVPKKLSQICSRCLEKAPEDRFSSAEELYRELLIATKPQANTRVKLLLMVASSVIVLLFAFGGWLFVQWEASEQVNEFLTSEGAKTTELYSSLPAGKRIDNCLLKEASSVNDVKSTRARIAYDARMGDAQAVVDALESILERDRQFVSSVMRAKPDAYLAHLERLLLEPSAARGEAMRTMILVAPENKQLNQLLSNQRTRAEFLYSYQDWGGQIDCLLDIVSTAAVPTNRNSLSINLADQTPVLATALSILGEHDCESTLSKLIETVSLVRDSTSNAEIHCLCERICRKSSEPKPKSPTSIEGTNPVGINLVSVSINQRDYWVSDSEISVGQYIALQLEKDNAQDALKLNRRNTEAKSLDHPITGVNWYEALEWCNKLSKCEGLEPCYAETAEMEELKSVLNGRVTVSVRPIWEFFPEKSGYRLPTVQEWGAIACSDFGSDNLQLHKESYLKLFANFQSISTAPIRSRLPNKHGLFDTLGNVAEWCWDRSGLKNRISHGNQSLTINVSVRPAMGGGFSSLEAQQCDSNNPLWLPPETAYPMIGFRVVRIRE